MPLSHELKVKNNSPSVYFPISARNDKSNEFDWELVVGLSVMALYRLQLQKQDLNGFRELCAVHVEKKLREPQYWQVIEHLYFTQGNVYGLAPELQAFKALRDENANLAPAERMVATFRTLLGDFWVQDPPVPPLNFIERELKTIFDSGFISKKGLATTTLSMHPSIPCLADVLQQDLKFMSSNPKFFLSSIQLFWRFYAFVYTAQLALSIRGWKAGEPKLQDCYFILEGEKASKERSMLQQRGSKSVQDGIKHLFPLLALNEGLQDLKVGLKPLWMLVSELTEGDVIKLNAFIEKFAEDRGLSQPEIAASSATEAIEQLGKLYFEQFAKGTSRETAYQNFNRATQAVMLRVFEQARGSAGKVYVLNQDYLLLLTNLAIGDREKLRLHELLNEFKRRGVCLDKQSQAVLVELYERLGNVERMSDSGDAVYVKKTI